MAKNITRKDKKERITILLDAYEKSAGNLTTACKKANITRKTAYEWINESDGLKEKIDDIKEGLIDFAETQLMKNIKAGKEASIFFFLKTQAKNRGYVEKQEVDMKVENIEVVFK